MGRPLSPLARRLGLRVGRRGAGCLAHSGALTRSMYLWRPDENLAWGIVRQAQQDTEYSPLWGAGGRVICEPRGTEAGFVTCAPRRFDRGADCRTFTATCLGGLLNAHVMNPAGVGRVSHVV